MLSLPSEILGYIYYLAGPTPAFHCKLSCRQLHDNFYQALNSTCSNYDLNKLPYIPDDILERYKVICAVFEPALFGSDLITQYCHNIKRVRAGIDSPYTRETSIIAVDAGHYDFPGATKYLVERNITPEMEKHLNANNKWYTKNP